MEQGEAAENHHHVVHIGDDGGYGEAPFETHGEVDDDADHYHAQGQQAVGNQLFAHLRADEFNLAQAGIGMVFAQQFQYVVGKLGRGHVLAVGQADHQLLVGAQTLHLGFAHFELVQARAHLVWVGAFFGVLHFDNGAAGELNRVVEPFGNEEKHGGDERNQRNQGGDFAVAHERDVVFQTVEEIHLSAPWR